MSLKKLYQKKEFFLKYLVKDMDYVETPIVLGQDIYKELIRANKAFKKLNKYIYEYKFVELINYLDIKSSRLKKFIIKSYNSTTYKESNFINRGDFFITQEWVQVLEINNDTPGWYIETNMLNSDIPDDYHNPNIAFYKNYIKEIKKYNPKYVYITWSLAQVEDYKLMNFVKQLLISVWINSSVWYLDNLSIKKKWIYHHNTKVDIIFKYYPIDEIYEHYNMDNIEIFALKKKVVLLNHPISYIFQLKSYYAFLWEQKDILPVWIQEIIESHIPMSIRMDNELIKKWIDVIKTRKDEWVLKDINNREWNNIFIWKNTEQVIWDKYLESHIWDSYRILQKKIDILPIQNLHINFWIYNIWDKFSWIFTRVHDIRNKTDEKAIVVWTCVRK